MRKAEYSWNLRRMMAERGLYATTDLAPLLAERGIQLSPTHVYRLVTGKPERLNLQVLSALCDALECSPSDLITTTVVESKDRARKSASGPDLPVGADAPTPVRVRVVRDK